MFFRTFHLALILLAAAAVWFSIESGAQAGSCGDYLLSSHVDEATDTGHFGDRHPTPRPCHGPSCSRSPAAPADFPLAKTFEPFGTRLSGLLTQALADQDSCSEQHPDLGWPPYSLYLAHEIFHPPRLG
jgi:hypothetical protein